MFVFALPGEIRPNIVRVEVN